MKLSRYFRDHSESYHAEIDDLTSDSEGKDVLAKRLAEKRKQLDFLVMMMEESPEMLAVVFHQGFGFPNLKAMDALVGKEMEDFPDWDVLSPRITVAPWAVKLVARVLQEPMGEIFMAAAVGLEYLHSHANGSIAPASDEEDSDDDNDDHDDSNEDEDGNRDETGDGRNLDEAGGDWMEAQGFDRKG
jgi:hypothetical protein